MKNFLTGARREARVSAALLVALTSASTLVAQDPTPPPAQPAQPAQPPQPATPPLPAWAPMAPMAAGQRRGWFGISLSCDDCFIQRGAGRVAYVQPPAVNSVEPGSPAWQAGMRAGDTIISVEGLPITQPDGFERFATAQAGQSIRLGLRRGGQEREVQVVPIATSSASTVAEFYGGKLRTAQRNGYRALQSMFRTPLGWLGMAIDCEQCSVNTLPRRGAWSFRQPPAVYSVDADGPAHRMGIRRGDTLTAIDGVELTDPAGGRAFAQVEPGQRVTLTVRKDGRERRVQLVAVARPDATPQELQAFDEYKRMRDSTETQYREVVSASVARAQTELTDLQRSLRELEASRGSVDSSRRRIATIDSLLRALRNIERQRVEGGSGYGYGYSTPQPFVLAAPNVTVTAPMVIAGARTTVYPLRYSRHLGDIVNVEARAPGPISVSEVGDSLVVVTTTGGVQVKIQLLPGATNRR